MNVKNKENTKEKLDQHFMINQNLLDRIIDYAELSKQDIILEIGPGKGALTELLIKKAFVYAVEIDREMIQILNQKFNKIKNKNKIRIILGNALKIIKKLNFNKIVANIPYTISEPLLKQILIKHPEIVVLTVGEKFIDHLKNNELFNIVYNLEIKELVDKKDFFPVPKTNSMIVKFELKKDKMALFFQDLLKQYDKKIKNALQKYLKEKLTKNQVRDAIAPFTAKNKSIISIDNTDIMKLKQLIKSFIN